MATEIELKAHVQDSGALRLLLAKQAEYKNAYEKEDTYWLPQPDNAANSPKIRLRRETCTFPDGTAESASFVTCKIKQLSGGIETNDELEFEVSSAEAFEELLLRMGYQIDASKRKKGWAFRKDDITAELSEVSGSQGRKSLGWYIELEILADNSREETVAEGRQRLIAFLTDLGMGEDSLETRFYVDMLEDKW